MMRVCLFPPPWQFIRHSTSFCMITYAVTCRVALTLLYCPKGDPLASCHAYHKSDPEMYNLACILVIFHVFGFPLISLFGAERVRRRAQGGSCCRDTEATKDSQLHDKHISEHVRQWRFFINSDIVSRFHWFRGLHMLLLLILVWSHVWMQPLPCRPLAFAGNTSIASADGIIFSATSVAAVPDTVTTKVCVNVTQSTAATTTSKGEVLQLCPTADEIGSLDLQRSLLQGLTVFLYLCLMCTFRPYVRSQTRRWKLYVTSFNKATILVVICCRLVAEQARAQRSRETTAGSSNIGSDSLFRASFVLLQASCVCCLLQFVVLCVMFVWSLLEGAKEEQRELVRQELVRAKKARAGLAAAETEMTKTSGSFHQSVDSATLLVNPMRRVSIQLEDFSVTSKDEEDGSVEGKSGLDLSYFQSRRSVDFSKSQRRHSSKVSRTASVSSTGSLRGVSIKEEDTKEEEEVTSKDEEDGAVEGKSGLDLSYFQSRRSVDFSKSQRRHSSKLSRTASVSSTGSLRGVSRKTSRKRKKTKRKRSRQRNSCRRRSRRRSRRKMTRSRSYRGPLCTTMLLSTGTATTRGRASKCGWSSRGARQRREHCRMTRNMDTGTDTILQRETFCGRWNRQRWWRTRDGGRRSANQR